MAASCTYCSFCLPGCDVTVCCQGVSTGHLNSPTAKQEAAQFVCCSLVKFSHQKRGEKIINICADRRIETLEHAWWRTLRHAKTCTKQSGHSCSLFQCSVVRWCRMHSAKPPWMPRQFMWDLWHIKWQERLSLAVLPVSSYASIIAPLLHRPPTVCELSNSLVT